MGFVMGSCSFSHPPLHHQNHSHLLSSSSQSFIFYLRNARTRRSRAPVASLSGGDSQKGVSGKRRAVVLLGVSVLPFLKLRAGAIEASTLEKGELKRLKPLEELAVGENSQPGLLFSLLNCLGIFGGGSLAALYALVLKEKNAAQEAIDSIRKQLEGKEAALVSLKNEFERKLENEQQERSKSLEKANQEQLSLISKLDSANGTITDMGRELGNEKRFCGELKVKIESLQSNLLIMEEDKKMLEGQIREKLESIEVLQERVNLIGSELKDKENHVQKVKEALDQKESELGDLRSMKKKLEEVLEEAESKVGLLKDEIAANQTELETKNSLVDELTTKISSLTAEKDDYKDKLHYVSEDYNSLKLKSDKQSALYTQLLEEKEQEIQKLSLKIEQAQSEKSQGDKQIADLLQQVEGLRMELKVESKNANDLKHERDSTKEALGVVESNVSVLEKQLNESKTECSKLQSDISSIRSEYEQVEKNYLHSLDEEKKKNEALNNELEVSNKLLRQTDEHLQTVSQELKVAAGDNERLQSELADAYKRTDRVSGELGQMKDRFLSLRKEVEDKERQASMEKETRKSLETDLEEATKSLDQVNQNLLLLSKELEVANSHISSLENERNQLQKSLTDEKNVLKEAQDNMEDAHSLIVRLGQEKETLSKKAKKLEEDLASAKGEILRLRSEANSPKVLVNSQGSDKTQNTPNQTMVTKRSINRRRRNTNSQ